MKATGIVRRIDDLGRVVIPTEIRRVMRIREGDPLDRLIETRARGCSPPDRFGSMVPRDRKKPPSASKAVFLRKPCAQPRRGGYVNRNFI